MFADHGIGRERRLNFLPFIPFSGEILRRLKIFLRVPLLISGLRCGK